MNKKERLVAAIEQGTVIDHIPTEKTYQVASLLGLFDLKTPVTIGFNYPSQKVGSKGIIKVSDKFFTDDEISRLSVVAPKVILSIIRDYEVVEKKTVETPAEIREVQQSQVHHQQRAYGDALPRRRRPSDLSLLRERTGHQQGRTRISHTIYDANIWWNKIFSLLLQHI
jgi:aspartate carbamoyltransferase regulatory subunit